MPLLPAQPVNIVMPEIAIMIVAEKMLAVRAICFPLKVRREDASRRSKRRHGLIRASTTSTR
jgi:hypothetical protein